MPTAVSSPTLLVALIVGISLASGASADEWDDQVKLSTHYQMVGAYDRAEAVAIELTGSAPKDAIGYALHLNVLSTRLSWDANQRQFDEAIKQNAEQVLEICEGKIRTQSEAAMANYYCGQANFSLALLYGTRGQYYAAGVNGTHSIKRLETALEIDPTLIDAKLYLGMAYYYADNLPPFVKAISHLLWFIPTGNSEKSLPYIQEVMKNGNVYLQSFRFVYSDLIRERDPAAALDLLAQLAKDYPENSRIHLAHTSLLVEKGQYASARDTIQRLLDQSQLPAVDLYLLRLWLVRADLGLHDVPAASTQLQTLDAAPAELPTWALPWLSLTRAQIMDLSANRESAKREYLAALKSNEQYGSESVERAAQAGLKRPYVLERP